MNHWMEITYDWCISRQLWWGHQIPAWYKEDQIYVGMEPPKEEGWVQDEDVLDTWFSSALWPFSTLGWPDETPDFKRYYPNNVLVTGYDIIPFWVNRMTFQGLEFTKTRPFKDCLIHGLIRDKEGRKMSKSLGNGVDPMDVIDTYGADALRFFLTTTSALGTDLRYDEEKVKSTWNFINKLWNAARFVLLKLENSSNEAMDMSALNIEDKWILHQKNQVVKIVTEKMDKYEFHTVGAKLYEFIWNDFCDHYIELVKNNTTANELAILVDVLTTILKLLHPFMPYVTEEIYQMLPVHDESIMISPYPIFDKKINFEKEAQKFDKVLEDIVAIRNLKATNKIDKNAKVFYQTEEIYQEVYKSQLKILDENCVSEKIRDLKEINYTSPYIHLSYFVEEREEDIEQIKEEIKKLEASIERRKKLLSNSNYVSKAPEKIVSLDREKLKEEEEKRDRLKKVITP